MLKSKSAKIIVIVVVVILIGLLVWMLTRGSTSSDNSAIVPTSSENGGVNAATVNADAQELLGILQSLNSLQLDHSFLTSRPFLNLVDYSVVLPVSVSGRMNPFDVVSPNEPPFMRRNGASQLPSSNIDSTSGQSGDINPSFSTETATDTIVRTPATTTRTTTKPKP